MMRPRQTHQEPGPWELAARTPNDMNVPGWEPSDTVNLPERPPQLRHCRGTWLESWGEPAMTWQQYQLIPAFLLCQVERFAPGNWCLLLLEGLCVHFLPHL